MAVQVPGPSVSVEYQQLLQAISTCAAPVVHQLVRQFPGSVHQKGWNGQTALHKACLGGDWTINYLLLEAGADPNSRSDHEETPLHYACRRGDVSVVHLLVQHKGDITLIDKAGKGMVHHAAMTCSVYVLHYLSTVHDLSFHQLDNKKQSPLHICCESGSMEAAVKYLIRKERSDVFQQDSLGNTPLHVAANHGHAYIIWLLLLVGGLRLLHVPNNNGDTPVSLAKEGPKLVHKYMRPYIEYLEKQPQNSYPIGPTWMWYWYLLMPASLFLLTVIVAQVIGSPYQGFVFIVGLGYIVSCTKSHSHRITHISRWADPIYAGTFAAGISHTFIIYSYLILPNVYHYKLLTLLSLFLAVGTLYLYAKLLRRNAGITKECAFKANSSERMTMVDLIGPPTKLGLFCSECEIVLSPKSKHCRLCECCYEEMDHHCLFLMNCVARDNHLLFVWFLILLSLCMIVFVVNAVVYCSLFHKPHITTDLFGELFKSEAWLLTMVILNIVSAFWSINLIRFQLSLISIGLTTYLRPSRPNTVLTTTERIINVVYFLQGKPIFAKDPLFDV